uniref:Uncharacterized protein n=1 Tax=Glossina pallidipes TaxID=7398 RepID=A0A1B0AJI2_GLOPL
MHIIQYDSRSSKRASSCDKLVLVRNRFRRLKILELINLLLLPYVSVWIALLSVANLTFKNSAMTIKFWQQVGKTTESKEAKIDIIGLSTVLDSKDIITRITVSFR